MVTEHGYLDEHQICRIFADILYSPEGKDCGLWGDIFISIDRCP